MKMRMKTVRLIALLAGSLLLFAGCRVRTSVSKPEADAIQAEAAAGTQADGPGNTEGLAAPEEQTQEGSPDRDSQSRETPEASRREYDENAGAEIAAGTDRSLHTEGERDGLPLTGENTETGANQLHADSIRAAKLTVPTDDSDRMGVSPDAEEADSALRYYTVLLQDRLGTLFECKRMNVYWETAEDHVTIYRTSQEHRLILDSGCYDVAGRLTEERLRVDDGWIDRKNPEVIVKVVKSSILGSRVYTEDSARQLKAELVARPGWNTMTAVREDKVLLISEELLEVPYLRVAAMLVIAQTAYPDLFADTDPTQALEALTEEATGTANAISIFWYK